ncbi:hypothetical protein FQA39_LY17552 [Lamprigera yunnana]|nr:hypothetical protein FQA39_LY17552 [Lamprigera yunnana]
MEEVCKVIDDIIYTPQPKHQIDVRGIGWVYYDFMSKYRERIAQIDGLTDKKDTYGDLLERCVQTALRLKVLGVCYGDVVSICSYNHLNSCVPHISSFFIGAKIAGFDPSLSLRDAIHLYRLVLPRVIFVGPESVQLIENVLATVNCNTTVIVFGQTDKYTSFSEFIEPHLETRMFEPVTPKNMRDIAVIMFSSGTSGFPKGICHTHHSILSFPYTYMKLGRADSIMFSSDSPYWNVFFFWLHHSVCNGVSRILFPKFDFDDPWKIFKHHMSTALLNTTELIAVCNAPKPESVDTSPLKILLVSGSTVSREQMLKARSLFPSALVYSAYGQSEVFMAITWFDPSNPIHLRWLKEKPTSCGTVKKGISYKVVDPLTEKVLGPNEKGELRLQTELQLSGYYNADSSDAWDKHGWLKTGDYGYYDEDCCFYIVDRIKEMFKYRYWHIVPAVLEHILMVHPDISRAVVIGIPHETDGHHPMAVVKVKDSTKDLTVEEITKYMEDRVEDRQRLRGGIIFVDNFPLTPSGKVNRRALKKMILENL